GVVVVDYKLSRGGEARHDLVQLAIYARLLKLARPGLAFTGLLEYYGPELTVVEASPAELDDLFDTLVQPVIEELAAGGAVDRVRPGVPAAGGGSRVAAGAAPATPAAPPVGEAPQPDHSALIEATFAAFKLDVSVVGKIEAPQLLRYQVRPG